MKKPILYTALVAMVMLVCLAVLPTGSVQAAAAPGDLGGVCINNQCSGALICNLNRCVGCIKGRGIYNGQDCPSASQVCDSQGACVDAPNNTNGSGNTTSGGGGGGGGISGGSSGTVKASDVGYSFDRLRAIFVDGVCQLMRLAVVIAVIFLVYVGFLFMRAGGDPKQVSAATASLTYVIIGIVIIVGIDVILATVGNAVSNSYSILDCTGSGVIIQRSGTTSNP